MWMVLATALSLTACAGSSGNNGCSVFGPIHPDTGFETRWTPRERLDVLKHDEVYADVCGR